MEAKEQEMTKEQLLRMQIQKQAIISSYIEQSLAQIEKLISVDEKICETMPEVKTIQGILIKTKDSILDFVMKNTQEAPTTAELKLK